MITVMNKNVSDGNLESALGNLTSAMTEEGKDKWLLVGRSAVIDQGVAKGEKLTNAKVKFIRPDYGIAIDEFDNYLNLNLNRSIPIGSFMDEEYLS